MAVQTPADRLLTTAKIRLPAVTDAALNLELFNTVDEHLRSSNAWRYQEQVPVIENTSQFPIFPPAGTEMVRVLAAEHNGMPLSASNQGGTSTTITQAGRIIGNPDPVTFDTEFIPNTVGTTGGIYRYSIFFPAYLTIDIPASADAAQFPINIILALTMSDDNLQDTPDEWPLEDWMWGVFHEAWLDGVLSKLMSQIGKPYSNTQMAQYHGRRFRAAMGKDRQEANRGYVMGKRRLVFPGWA